MTVNEIIEKMIVYSDGNKHDIAHFLKVYTYARMIGEMENLPENEQKTLEVAAVIHDIACPVCRIKYGNTNGSNQEKESPRLVEDFLKDTDLDEQMKERINYLVSHHHTYTNVDGMDYRILLEADFLVNADESQMSQNAIETAREKVFETETGRRLLTGIYKLENM
ncbi:MAG: HD domain-containing protein [Clostridia bacterium]|nr:HD domain-containing protein [Clostridia bacterium]